MMSVLRLLTASTNVRTTDISLAVSTIAGVNNSAGKAISIFRTIGPRFENTTALPNALPLYFNHNGMNKAEVFNIADP